MATRGRQNKKDDSYKHSEFELREREFQASENKKAKVTKLEEVEVEVSEADLFFCFSPFVQTRNTKSPTKETI